MMPRLFRSIRWALLAFLLTGASTAFGQEPLPASPGLNSADTGFVLASVAMAFLMVPGLGLFYAGMVRRKNVLATFQQSFILLGVIGLQWILIGYGLTFGTDLGRGVIGSPHLAILGDAALQASPFAPSIPAPALLLAHLVPAVFATALISGAVAERMKFSAYLAFSLLWATLVYAPVAHWVWGGGWIAQNVGVLDFSGALVIHLTAGFSALCAAILVGRRRGMDEEDMLPHNLMLTGLGTGLLWFGWLGLSGIMARGANGLAVLSMLNTVAAGAAGLVAWTAVEWLHKGKATVLGSCTGVVAGLVAISAGAGYIPPIGALGVGILSSLICYAALLRKSRQGFDDSLDVFRVHATAAVLGLLATGLLASSQFTALDVQLAPEGSGAGPRLLLMQFLGILIVSAYAFAVTFVILKVVQLLIGLRVPAEDEDVGLDLSQHGQRGYIMEAGEYLVRRIHDAVEREEECEPPTRPNSRRHLP